MEIGNDDLDFIDEEFGGEDLEPQDTGFGYSSYPNSDDGQYGDDEPEGDFLDSLLRSRGITDKSRIIFENEYGAEEEVNWDDLSNREKLNIINSGNDDPDVDLDDAEVNLINSIRSSNMTPEEYLGYVSQQGALQYALQSEYPSYTSYTVDNYSDDELFVMDFIARMGDVTDDEALEALQNAKSNETLYAKLIGAIRNEYKQLEDAINLQQMYELEQYAQALYNQFSNSIIDQINNLTEFSGYDLNLEADDMQQLYDFITGVDAAGNNHFAKALADPRTLVRTAYLALNGQQMVNDITNYFQKEIAQVRRNSYERGREDALNKMNNSNVVFKNRSSNRYEYDADDLD